MSAISQHCNESDIDVGATSNDVRKTTLRVRRGTDNSRLIVVYLTAIGYNLTMAYKQGIAA